MLNVTTEVHQGIPFIKLLGNLNQETFKSFSEEISYLLYNQGFQYFVFDFQEIENFSQNIFSKIQNTLVEIFLSCGKVVMCGLNELSKKLIGNVNSQLFYVNHEIEAFKYLSL